MKRCASVIFPAARNEDLTQSLVDNLHDTNPNIDVDVVVSSPSFNICRATNIRDDYIGIMRAVCYGLPHAKGDYVGWLTDETRTMPNCLEHMIDFIDSRPAPFIAEFCVGDPGGQWDGRRFARWGMLSKKTVEMIGFFDPGFASFWSDVDFSCRCWSMGGSVDLCPTALVVHTPIDDDLHRNKVHKYADGDLAYFYKKWPQYIGVPT
jgi:GT2 family glycosyltransferase